MSVGRYLRGEDRHVGTARVSKIKQQNTKDIYPMDTPLPCDVKVGHVTIRKGVALRTLVMRMQVLYDMAQQRPSRSDIKPLTDEEMYLAIRPLYKTDALANAALSLSKDEYRAIEAATTLRIKT
jgi:hypothetical protein